MWDNNQIQDNDKLKPWYNLQTPVLQGTRQPIYSAELNGQGPTK